MDKKESKRKIAYVIVFRLNLLSGLSLRPNMLPPGHDINKECVAVREINGWQGNTNILTHHVYNNFLQSLAVFTLARYKEVKSRLANNRLDRLFTICQSLP